MLSDEELEAALALFRSRWDKIREMYLRLVGEHLKRIGTLTASDLYRVEQIAWVSRNMAAVEKEIAAITGLSVRDVQALFREASRRVYEDAGYLYEQLPFEKNEVMLGLLRSQTSVTLGELVNLSRTTIDSSAYRTAVDTAVTVVHSGVESYNRAIASVIRQVASEGLRVRYASGLTRRLDTAARQNVLDGVRSLNRSIARAVGREFNSDGVEISAHLDCAIDHVEIQGRQYSNADYEALQSELERPVGTMNCKHFPFPILLGVSEAAYPDDELERINAQSKEQISIDGVTKSRYDWTQEQRRLETAVRYQKDAAVLAKSAGNDIVRREAQANINRITSQYGKISEAAGLPQQRERMRVSGFRPVSVH